MRATAVRGDVPPTDQRKRPDGLLGDLGYRVVSSPRIDLVSWSPPLEYQVAAGSITTPASSPAAFAVGALCWQSRSLEPYSSQGPTIDGRTKPDIVGHDSVSGATYGGFSSCPSAFAGTSASSPEVAGAAALVKQAYPSVLAGSDQVLPHERSPRSGRSRDRQRVRRRRAPASETSRRRRSDGDRARGQGTEGHAR